MTNLFEEINQKKSELDNIIREYGETAIKEYLKEFWEQNPTIEGIRWEQYTPYFNDGDPCVFGVGEVRAKISTMKIEDDDSEYGDGYMDPWEWGWAIFPDAEYAERNEKLKTVSEYVAIKALNEIWQNNEQTLLVVFGDHARVTADREKIDVEEYSHD